MYVFSNCISVSLRKSYSAIEWLLTLYQIMIRLKLEYGSFTQTDKKLESMGGSSGDVSGGYDVGKTKEELDNEL